MYFNLVYLHVYLYLRITYDVWGKRILVDFDCYPKPVIQTLLGYEIYVLIIFCG